MPDLTEAIEDVMSEHEQLERLMHRELRKLPDLRAPETLVHRVMLSVHAKERQPWWQRPWLSWPLPAQWISTVVFAVTVVALIYFGAQAWQLAGIGNPLDRIWVWILSLAPLWDWLITQANSAALVLQKGGQKYLFIGLGVAATMYLFCVATGTACYRLAFNRR